MTPKRILVLGCDGLLGQKVTEGIARGTSHRVMASSRSEKPLVQIPELSHVTLDITKKADVKQAVAEWEPHVIVNAAAMTNVDACEKERELAWKINVTGVEHVIEAARRIDATIIHISTDYVFDGKTGPYDEDDKPSPLNYYGRSKLASENQLKMSGLNHVIFRTIVLYGYATNTKSNFALWLIQNLEQQLPVRVVDDQFGNPTLADDLSHAIINSIQLGKSGVYHIGGREIVSRYEFAVTLARTFGFNRDLITPIKTSMLKQSAQRPMRSGLFTLKAETELGYKPSTVEEGLMVVKSQLSRNPRRMPDSAPMPGFGGRKR
jgi:dTDP-4-dehydrorhamnose reductase